MSFLLLNLLQSQPRLSKFVIVGAALVLIAGVSLLVYFYRRYKRIEGEPEEDWELSRSSLFANVAPSARRTEEVSGPASEASAPAPEKASAESRATREFASEIEVPSTVPESRVEAAPPREAAPPKTHAQPSEHRLTEMLASPSPTEPVTQPEAAPAAFDDEVWAGLEAGEQPPIAHEHLEEPTRLELPPERVARVDQRSHLEPFEPPSIERILNREPFEPPRIEPLTPREQETATREMRSPQIPETPKNKERSGRETALFGSTAGGFSSPALTGEPARRAERDVREPAAEPVGAASGIAGRPASKPRRAPAGSVLGLPAETSHKPLILGEPVRSATETGIGALSNYGKDANPTSSRAGTIALLIVAVLLGGALAMYFFVPSMHARVNAFVAHVRGTDVLEAQEAAMKPKAQVIPSYRPEVNKNMVKARGAVDNISDGPLENLTIEISLLRGADAPPETRTVSVTPNPLPQAQRGTFEFEYDGKRDTGFTGYKITRLLSNGIEIRFRTPGK